MSFKDNLSDFFSSVDAKMFVTFVGSLMFFVCLLVSIAIVANNTNPISSNSTTKIPDQPESEQPCPANSQYCTLKYDSKDYLIYNKAFPEAHDVVLFNTTKAQSKKLKDFSLMSYDEYKDFCKKFSIKQKFSDKDLRYIVYYQDTGLDSFGRKADRFFIELSDVYYNNDTVTLYLWERIIEANGIIGALEPGQEPTYTSYAIIIPTEHTPENYIIEPVIHRTEYNKIAHLNPATSYDSNRAQNSQLSPKVHLHTKNTELNNIINTSLDALSLQHTVEINSSTSNSKAKFDLFNSIAHEQPAIKAHYYHLYTPEIKITFQSFAPEDTEDIQVTKFENATDRSQILADIIGFSEPYDHHILDLTKNTETSNDVKITTDDLDYIIEYGKTTYYINKKDFLVDKIVSDKDIYNYSYIDSSFTLPDNIDQNSYAPAYAKPIIYLYPTKTTGIKVALGHPELITTSYPKYTNGWQVTAKPSGDLVDRKTGRKLYSLYWEGKNADASVKSNGFVIRGSDTAAFLEEKLALLGLNEREAEEFIIYWLPKMEHNKYNYIRFQTRQEIDHYMPLNITPKPDTTIRIFMAYKPLETPINVTEQKLSPQTRKGYTAVEWGGAEIK